MTSFSTKHRLESLVQAACWFPTELLAYECDLVSTKWFDYRFMSPLQATKHFARIYSETFQRFFARDLDRDQARNVIGSNPAKFSNDAKERTQLWMARVRADEVGMRYEEYIGFSFDFSAKRGLERKRLPRPNQLHHSSKDAHALWVKFRTERWQEVVRDRAVSVSDIPAYRADNRRGYPAQDAFRDFAVEQSLAGGLSLGQAMERYCLQIGQLRFADYKERFDQEVYEREKAHAESSLRDGRVTPVPAPVLTQVSLLPSCFGLPWAPKLERQLCANCPVHEQCLPISVGVLKKVKERTGTETPVEDAGRMKNAARARKCRAKKKMAAAISSLA